MFKMDGMELQNYGDLTNVAAAGSFDLMPKDQYKVISDYAEIKKTKAGTGTYLSLCFRVIEGAFEGRKIWANFNIQNPNPTAVKIGLSELKQFMLASNSPQKLEGMNDVITSIVGYKCWAHVDIEKSDKYGEKNIIVKYSAIDTTDIPL